MQVNKEGGPVSSSVEHELPVPVAIQRTHVLANKLIEVFHWIVVAIQWPFRTFVEWSRRRETYLRLMSLDHHLLQDIGLSRADVWSAAKGNFRKTAANNNSSTKSVA